MKLNYENTNELYSLLHPLLPQNNEFMGNLGHAINLIDECELYGDNSHVTITSNESVLVTFKFDPCWPEYLIEEVENGDVTVDSACNNFVTVKL